MKTYYVGSISVSDELYHHGIKGQKWGIRRYQNEDRTLTAAGKERYKKKADKFEAKANKASALSKEYESRHKQANSAIERLKSEKAGLENTIRDYERRSEKMQKTNEWTNKNLGFDWNSEGSINRNNKKIDKFMKKLNETEYSLNQAIQNGYKYKALVDKYVSKADKYTSKSNLFRSLADEGITLKQRRINEKANRRKR